MEEVVLTGRRNHGTEIIGEANEEPRMLGGDGELRFFLMPAAPEQRGFWLLRFSQRITLVMCLMWYDLMFKNVAPIFYFFFTAQTF